MKHFTFGEEAIDFINNFPNKDQLFLLVDFELLKQELNGLHVIEQTNIKRSVLVTSHHNNLMVRNLVVKRGAKILPKQLASEVPIKIDGVSIELKDFKECSITGIENGYESGKTVKDSNAKKVDVVLLDDEELLLASLSSLLEARGKTVDKYNKPKKFLEKLAQYDKDTKIFMDNDFKSYINGVDLAKQLHEKGYTNLYLFSGADFTVGEIPNYLTVISKTDISRLFSFLD